ncbi:MAG: hypothetical protein AAF264_05425 [Pseudomonadota bacterium]
MERFVRTAVPQDVGAVLAALSPRMEQEFPLLFPALTGPDRRRLVVRHALAAIAADRASTFVAGATPVCVLVLAREPDGPWSIMTLATEPFYARAFLRMSRLHLAEIQAELGTEILAHTRSDHPRAAPWLRFLGFEHQPAAQGSADAPRYVRPWPKDRA